jgi:FlaA1/EpsC-like NDP-sugar epimerase
MENCKLSHYQSTRVAVVGAGYWARNLVRNFAELRALAAICDPDRQAAEALATKHGAPVVEFDEVLQDRPVARMAIAAPALIASARRSRGPAPIATASAPGMLQHARFVPGLSKSLADISR